MTTQQSFALALQHHQAGRLRDAEALYRQILAAQPNHAEALHFLGVIAQQAGRHELAIEWIGKALVLDPDNPVAHSNLGEALRAMGRLDEAIAAYRRALALRPDSPAAHNNLGNALNEQGRTDEALAAYRQALALKPDYPEAHNNLGIALARQNQHDAAVAAYRRALDFRPGYAEAHNNLGNTLREQGKLNEAVAACRRALELKPDHPEAHNNLGIALAAQFQFDEAVAAYRRALALKPNYAEAHNNLGHALTQQEQIVEAMAAYRRALTLKPDYAEAHNNLGDALRKRGQIDEALAACRRALALKPDYPDACLNLGNTLLHQGQQHEAITALRRALVLRPDRADVHSNLIYTLHFDPRQDDRALAGEYQRWNRQFSKPLQRSILPQASNPDPTRRLRLGYVSPSFRSNAVAFFLTPLLEAHDHGSFEIYCYASVRRPDAVTERLRKSADVWREVRALSDAQLAARVRDDGIDILVDLSMHTGDNRLPTFARKPAPVQVSWLAYPGSAGVEAIDCRLTDAYIDPAGKEDTGAGEEVVRLPDAWCCYAPIEAFPLVSPLPAAQKGTVTFGSLNQFGKIHEELLRCWARLLGAVPDSQLLIVCPEGHVRERTHALLTTHGIARERVELVAPCPWPDYIRLLKRVDVVLDTFPCNGMTTTCHALWMGVPVVTLTGASAVSRAGDSLLHAVGLPELVARSEGEYIRIAAEWAANLPRLADLRATLRSRMQASPLMDAPRFARNMEAAYRTMWQRWCAGRQS